VAVIEIEAILLVLMKQKLFNQFLIFIDKSNGYHPYRNNGRYPSNSNSSGSTRVVSVKEALKSERILSIESFAHVERINETEASHEYSLYVQKHVKNFLKNIYSRHKKEKW
jgi:hypothetical protein